MKKTTLLKLMWLWPPFLGAGVRVKHVSADFKNITVEMKLSFWNKNYFGTQYGGSLYSMTDPFYALMLLDHLGREYIVWDKYGSIDYVSPGRGKVYANFQLSQQQIDDIKTQVDQNGKTEYDFAVQILDESNKLIADVKKTLYIRRKDTLKPSEMT